MIRKLGIAWRSFKIKWLKGQRCKMKPSDKVFIDAMFYHYFINIGTTMKAWMKRKEKTITYYKNGKEYKRNFEDMNK